jgi:ketosteroid isomerase-like protein
MSQENVEVVQSLLARFIASGPEAVPANFIHDMRTFRGWLGKPVYHGVEGLAEFLGEWVGPYDDWSIAIEQVLDAGGDRVVAVLAQRGRLPDSEADVVLRFGIVYTVEKGEARHAQNYTTAEEAFEAVGLRE